MPKMSSYCIRSLRTYSQGALEGNLVPLDALDGSIGDGGPAVLKNGGHVNRLPRDWGLHWTGKLMLAL